MYRNVKELNYELNPLKTENKIHDFFLVPGYFFKVAQFRFGCMYNLPKLLLFAYIIFTSKRFGHMQPPVVKYQDKKETQVTKNELWKIYSDIEKKFE